jgi:hypothetical protein
MIIRDCTRVGDGDCRLELVVQGKEMELFARRIRADATIPQLGAFEPVRLFRDTSMSVEELHALVRTAILVHVRHRVSFPIDVPNTDPASS